MPVDIEGRINGTYVMEKIEKQSRTFSSSKRLDWMTSRNYNFIPYKELSEYQKQMVRNMLDARRMYQRTGTSLQMHEQSVNVIRKMKEESKTYGVVQKQPTNTKQKIKRLEPEKNKMQDRRRHRQ